MKSSDFAKTFYSTTAAKFAKTSVFGVLSLRAAEKAANKAFHAQNSKICGKIHQKIPCGKSKNAAILQQISNPKSSLVGV